MSGCFLMSGVKILHFLKMMEIHSNSPKLYYGFKCLIFINQNVFDSDRGLKLLIMFMFFQNVL